MDRRKVDEPGRMKKSATNLHDYQPYMRMDNHFLPLSLIRSSLFFMLIALGIFSPTAFASSTSLKTALMNQPLEQDIARAGVSVVRLISTYTPGGTADSRNTQSATCTGLGMLVQAWPSTSPSEQNAWVLTDVSLLNPKSNPQGNAASSSCAALTPSDQLARLTVLLSSAYNRTQPTSFP